MADGSLLPMDGDTLPDGSVPLRSTPSLPLYPASFAPASQITCLQRVPPSNVAEGGHTTWRVSHPSRKEIDFSEDGAKAFVSNFFFEMAFDEYLGKKIAAFFLLGGVVVGDVVKAISLLLIFEFLQPPA